MTKLAPFVRLVRFLILSLAFLGLAVCLGAQVVVVVMRYGFSSGIPWLSDLAGWSFATLVMLAIPVALTLDGHVRIDIFRERQAAGARFRTDAIATLLLFVPMAAAIVITCFPQFLAAFVQGEASSQAGGLPGHWIVRFLPIAGFALAVVMALAQLVDRAMPHSKTDETRK
ncbi:MAG: TRAP transporter small permease subunit [Nitratireductor sp.]